MLWNLASSFLQRRRPTCPVLSCPLYIVRVLPLAAAQWTPPHGQIAPSGLALCRRRCLLHLFPVGNWSECETHKHFLIYQNTLNFFVQDVANSYATSVSSRSLTLVQAGCLATITEFVGAIALGQQVTATIRSGVFSIKPFDNSPGVLVLAMVVAEIGQ